MNTNDDARNQYSRTGTLELLSSSRAKSLYLDSRSDELAARSLTLHEKHVESFVSWYSDQADDEPDMNDLTARTVHEYKLHIKEGFAQSTLSIYLSTVRQFIEFCESIDGVEEGTSEKIVPKQPVSDNGFNDATVLSVHR